MRKLPERERDNPEVKEKM